MKIRMVKTVVFAMLIAGFGDGCKPPILPGVDQSSEEIQPLKEGVKFSIFINQKPIEGMIVAFQNFSGRTDQNGICYFKDVPNKFIEREGAVHVLYPPFKIDSILLLKIYNRTDIYLGSSIGDFTVLKDTIALDKTELDHIKRDLENAEQLLDSAERALRSYLKKHPESAIEDYLKAGGTMRSQLEQLKQNAFNILEDYASVIDQLEKGDIVDIGKHQRMTLEIRSQVQRFISRQSDFRRTQGAMLNADLEQEINTDIFFDEGKYLITDLQPTDQQKVASYIEKIRKFRNDVFSGEQDKALRFRLNVVGYTDGVPVGNNLNNEISPLCFKDNIRFSDPNDCLSYLRAKEIAHYFVDQLKIEDIVVTPVGKGSILAVDTQQRPSLRKSQLSFSIIRRSHYEPE